MVVLLKKCFKEKIPAEINEIFSKYAYVFNPSFIRHKNKSFLAIRAYDNEQDSIEALLVIWGDYFETKIIKLSDYFSEKLNLNKIADPKLCIINDTVWGSFNTGYSQKDNNKLVLFSVEKFNINNYYLCNYYNRKKVEKNWAFFSENENIYVLYGINPLIILKLVKTDLCNMYFEDYQTFKSLSYKNYTIGTPLVKINGEYFFIGHRKFVRKGKRLYLGKPFRFVFSEQIKLKSENKYLLHSIKDLLGSKYKFNKNLISCTYFSGIDFFNNNLYISYGINDVRWNIVRIRMKKIWR
ncbi:hypothetical protein RM697_01690 [Ichthyenterobacterium sp. W332]|uniref:Uncharacterized protein n=1 Tax=Microcosmobacter mediterraneus TaxID=3075607 RepID=A0ABU2YHT2_9FLAO|nr:hypothetical protein [Ichthyenterobacterium sp. W332]MDT0557340.1 hypothetical protein [Ichthyenterobacterium sp. W332]